MTDDELDALLTKAINTVMTEDWKRYEATGEEPDQMSQYPRAVRLWREWLLHDR